MASPFASLTTSDPIPLPFDEGQWIKVRKLTGQEHEAAQLAHRVAFVRNDKWAGVFRESLDKGLDATRIQRALADPLTGYDRIALVRAGLVAWSYERPIKPQTDPADDAIADLDDDALEFIAREVLKRTKPGLFLSKDEQEHERKNAIGSSTAA